MLKRLQNRKYVDQIALTPRAAANLEPLPEGLLVGPASEILGLHWSQGGLLIVVGAIGAVTRLIAPLLKTKDKDPAVIVLDARGINVVPLLGGHKAGAENLAIQLADELGGNVVITADSNTKGLLAIDSFGTFLERSTKTM